MPSTQVMIVDDDAAIRGSLRLGLEDDGWEIIESPTGEMALDLYAESPAAGLVFGAVNGNLARFSLDSREEETLLEARSIHERHLPNGSSQAL